MSTPPVGDSWTDELMALEKAGLLRSMRRIDSPQGPVVQQGERTLINFSSNDYLGLASSPVLAEAAQRAVSDYGVGAGASRLVCGTMTPHVELEEHLAQFKHTEAALAFSSGYATAMGTIPAIMGTGDVVILDKLAHACLIDAARLSGATLRVYPHNDLDKLRSHLAWARSKFPRARLLVVTESVFSMDGDRCPLAEIVALKESYGAMLLLDEAHATGVIGPRGAGLAAETGVADRVELQMGTFGKAAGVSGGYICGSRSLADLLFNRARSFVFSTAPLPALASVAKTAMQLLASDEGDRLRELLWKNLAAVAEGLRLPPPASAILPLLIGGEKEAVTESLRLEEEGLLIPAIRYPTVPKGRARLRLTLTALHTPEHIRTLIRAVQGLKIAEISGFP